MQDPNETYLKAAEQGVSLDPDLNWRERVLEALKEGQLTTTINYLGTNYYVVLQPYEGVIVPARIPTNMKSHRRKICGNCGDVIYQNIGEVPWYHLRGTVERHPAVPIDSWAEAAQPPVQDPKVGDTAVCSQCDKEIVYVSPYWQHTGLLNPKHPGIPKQWPVPGRSRLDQDICQICHRKVVKLPNGQWLHGENTYLDHNATPFGDGGS